MTVNDLIKQLQAMSEEDRERVVIMQKDGEGSDFSPLRMFDAGWYESRNTWSGDCHDLYEPGSEPALVLVPVN